MDNLQMETPDFIKSLFDDDSGLGMDFDQCMDSPSFFQTPEILCKRKRQNNEDPHVSSHNKRCVKSRAKHGLKKSLSFDDEIFSQDNKGATEPKLLSEDILVEGSVLRNHDREFNAENYPALCYPEIYILKGGYKMFYESHLSLCTPMNYTPMLSKDHKEDLRHFRSKSKSWYAGQKRIKSGSRLFC